MRIAFAASLILLATTLCAQEQRPHRPTPPQRFFDWTQPTFDAGEYAGRRARLIAELQRSGGGVFVTPSHEGSSDGGTFRQLDDFLYLTGLELPHSVLALDADAGTVTLFTPSNDRRFDDPARRNDFPGRRLGSDPALAERSRIADIRTFSAFDEALTAWQAAGRVVRVDPGRGGELPPIETAPIRSWSPARAFLDHLRQLHPALDVRSAFAEVAAVRMIKTPAEIAVVRRACAITARGIRAAAGAIGDGVEERALEGVLEGSFKAQGAQRPAFDSIIKSGPNSLWPWRILAAHYDRRNRAMHAGELVIFDVGCELDHYASDVGRTFPVGGRFTPPQRELLTMVTAVADRVIAAVRPGATLADLQQVAIAAIPAEHRRYMQAASFFGHHVGLAVGDPALTGVALAPGMVFTVEPWYYNHDEDVAVFVEDVVLVTDDGAENLTADLPRTSAALESMVGAAAPRRVTILSYNIRHGLGLDGKLDLERAARVIDALEPDVVALQEIDEGCGRSGGVDQAQRLGELTGMHAMFGAFMPYDGGRYGMALLSRHPVEAWENHRLPDGDEPRSTVAARIRVRGSQQRLVVAGIHLYRTEAERVAQAERLIELFGTQDVPVVLVGDFNSRPGSAVLELLDRHWDVAPKAGVSFTFPANAPDHEIDFVLTPNDGRVRVLDCHVVEDVVTSDHRPVLTVVELGG